MRTHYPVPRPSISVPVYLRRTPAAHNQESLTNAC